MSCIRAFAFPPFPAASCVDMMVVKACSLARSGKTLGSRSGVIHAITTTACLGYPNDLYEMCTYLPFSRLRYFIVPRRILIQVINVIEGQPNTGTRWHMSYLNRGPSDRTVHGGDQNHGPACPKAGQVTEAVYCRLGFRISLRMQS